MEVNKKNPETVRYLVPAGLKEGDEIRIIAPSGSAEVCRKEIYGESLSFLEKMGYRITFSENPGKMDPFHESASPEDRVKELHEAFEDGNVKGIIAVIGGFGVNEILPLIDYKVISENPKFFSGFSDITALQGAILRKTGLITFSGPFFATFGFPKNREYTWDNFKKFLEGQREVSLNPSEEAIEYKVIQEGVAGGRLTGGNLCTLNLLQGTPYMPLSDGTILFIEDDNISGDYFRKEFQRNLASLLQTEGMKVRGLLLGRFEESCRMDEESVKKIISRIPHLNNIPIVSGCDFGHVFPIATVPMGGYCRIEAANNSVRIDFELKE